MTTTTDTTASPPAAVPISPAARPWLWLSLLAVALAVIGNVVALSVDRIYENLTDVFLPQAIAQDVVDLALVAPLLVVCALLALRGSLRAWLVWLGALTFTVYNYVIYVVAIDFGPLFLLWTAVLGLALFSLIGGVGAFGQLWSFAPRRSAGCSLASHSSTRSRRLTTSSRSSCTSASPTAPTRS
jgi:hypothetical protein